VRNVVAPSEPCEVPAPKGRIFLLSPADCSGPRALLLHRRESDHDLARRLRGREGAALGEVFTFVSSMSRGGLLLRCVRERRELPYTALLGAERHGVRPPRLAPIARSR
jgi:hypothetical protein